MPTFYEPSRHALISRIGRNSRLLVVACLALGAAAAGYVGNHAQSATTRNVARTTPIESFDLGMKMGRHKIQLGTDTTTNYRAGTFSSQDSSAQPEQELSMQARALQSGSAVPLSMTNEDFDGDGMQDLVIGYASGAGGLLTLRRGNIEAISPRSPEAQAGLRDGRYQSPFVNDVDAYPVPENPDFLATGDFDADGHSDVVAAARNGQKLYFFAGDGKGGFKAMQEISLPGMITTITQGHFNEDGGLTSLAVGVITPDGPRVLVYDQGGKGVNGEADSFALPAPANALMLGNVDGDTAGDLIVGASNHVVMIHGRNPAEPAANQNRVEQFDVPYDIAAVSAGDFLFDREGKVKLALLSGDGTIHFLAPGALDTRPFTREEVRRMQKQRQAIRRGEAKEDSFQELLKSMVQRSGKGDGWTEQETRSTGATSFGANPQALLTKTATAGALLDQLLVLENNKIELIDHDSSIRPASLRQPEGTASVDTFDTEAAPIAVATMRLSMSGRPGTVILQSNQADPGLVVPMANTWNVNSNVDAVDDSPGNSVCHTSGGVCSLRAAMMESSYRGGDNIINLQSTTYTLTLNGVSGGADNEFGGAGDDQTGGDLDIVDLPDICTFLGGGNPAAGCPGLSLGTSLTSVTINGNGIANTIIQMGTLANVCNSTKDRILDVNPSADPQFPTNVIINSLTMQNGNAPNWNTTLPGCGGGGGFFHEDGGAIQFDGTKSQAPNAGPTATLTLTTVKIDSNGSAGQGGGVFVNFGSGISQTNSVITNNTTTFGSGGGLSYNGGNTNLTQTLQISGTTIGGAGAANTAPDATFGNGGGLNTNGGTGVTISNSTTISNNTAGNQGGGISFANSPVIAISNSTISNNTAKTNGGGIYCSARNAITNVASTATLTTTSVTGNTADSDNNGSGNGGGIYNLFGTLTIQTTSHIDGNSAINGGGIFDTWTANTNDTPAQLVVNTSSTIGQTGSGNSAKNNGGGIAIDLGGNSATTPKTGAVTLTSVTLQGNTANSDNAGGGDGGGIYQNGNDTNFKITCSLDGATIDSNVANSGGGGGTGTGIFMASGAMSGANTVSINGGNTLNINGGTFTSTSGTLNLSGDFTRASGGTFTHNSGTFNFNGSGNTQNINGTATSEAFNNFTVNKSSGTLQVGGSTTSLSMAGAVTLTSGIFKAGTATGITVSGGDWTNNATFTPDSSVVSFTNTAAGQNINGSATTQTFNGITVAKSAQTLTVGGSTMTLTLNGTMTLTSGTFDKGTATTINVGGDWTNNGGTFTNGSAGTVTFNGGGAQGLNGSAATQTFNNFTVNKTGTLTGGGSTTTLTLTGNMNITAGTLAAGTITTINDPGNWANTGTFTAGSSTVNLTGNNNTQMLTGSTTFNNLTCNHTGTGNAAASGSTLAVSGLMRVQSGTFISSSTYNNVQIDSGTTFQSDGSTMNVSGNWTNNGGTFTPNGNIVNFNGNASQSISGSATTQTFNGFTVNKGGGTLSVAASTTTLTLTGTLTLTAGPFDKGTAATINVAGDWTNNGGSFTAGTGTVNFNGSAQTVGGTTATTFNNLTDSDAAGINMNNDNTVNGVLALTSSDITVASTKTLTQPSTAGASTGTFDVIGNIKRTGANLPNTPLTYGNPDNVITLAASTLTSINVKLAKSVPTDANTGFVNSGFPGAVQRTYIITEVPSGNFTPGSTTLQLHYLSSELNSNSEATPGPPASLGLYRYVVNNPGTGWQQQDFPSGNNTTLLANHYVRVVGIKGFSPWTIANIPSPTAATGSIGGRITDSNGIPIGGTTINLSGTASGETITDSNGNYNFFGVAANGFYTITPSRANYSFSPANRSFSLLGVHTEASFTAAPNGDNVNVIDTTEFFVRQQYLDFLGREPDPPGFIGWVNTIRNCAAGDTSCDRVHVSEMFFRSAEFQQRGYFIYRFYSAAFGRKPDYAEFTPDFARVSGFLTEDQLEAAKTQFASDFTSRPAFANQYGSLGNSEYVDALSQTAGVTLSNRQALIDSLNAGTLTRAQVLRQIAESGEVNAKYYNQAFVVMEYFGYLRRDPDILYLNWIDVLNQSGDARHMVEGFVDSIEYRNRFKQ